MKKQMLTLARMQTFDDRIGDKLKQKEVLPQQLKELEQHVEDAEQKVKLAKEVLDQAQVEQKNKENEIQANKDLIAKYAVQLNSIKTNKEYKALNKEIEGLNSKNAKLEEEILKLMDDVTAKKNELKEKQNDKSDAEKELHSQEEELKKLIKAVDNDIEELKNERNKLAKTLPTPLTRRYILLLKNKNRKAVVYNQKNACSGCGYKIRPQVLLELEDEKKLHYCENCSRILMNKPSDL